MTSTSNSRAWLLAGGTAAVVMISSAVAQAPPGPRDEADAHEAANKSLQVLRSYMASKQPDAPGGNPETLVGAHFHDYVVGQKDLQGWDGKDPDSVLHSTGRIVFQIEANTGAPKSSVTIAKTGGTWNYVAFGTPKEARARSNVIPINAGDMQQIRVPTFNANFIGQRVDGVLEFTPISSVPKLGIEVGKTEAAKNILLRMQQQQQRVTSVVSQAQIPNAGPTLDLINNAAGLDYEFFKSKIQPIFLAARPGHARCVVCHTTNNAPLHLVPLSPGSTTWNEEQSRRNFQLVQKVVVPGYEGSKLVVHPLAEQAGGDPHHGGGQQFNSQNDPEWQTLKAFVLGAKAK